MIVLGWLGVKMVNSHIFPSHLWSWRDSVRLQFFRRFWNVEDNQISVIFMICNETIICCYLKHVFQTAPMICLSVFMRVCPHMHMVGAAVCHPETSSVPKYEHGQLPAGISWCWVIKATPPQTVTTNYSRSRVPHRWVRPQLQFHDSWNFPST